MELQRSGLDDDREHPVQVRPPVDRVRLGDGAATRRRRNSAPRWPTGPSCHSCAASWSLPSPPSASLRAPVAAPRAARADEIAPELETLGAAPEGAGRSQAARRATLAPSDRAGSPACTSHSTRTPSDPERDGGVRRRRRLRDRRHRRDAAPRLDRRARAELRRDATARTASRTTRRSSARSQVPGRRLLPPPPGFYTAQRRGPRRRNAPSRSALVRLARELTHLRAGDLGLRAPDRDARERRRRVDGERAASGARDAPRASIPGSATPRDEEATTRVLDAGRERARRARPPPLLRAARARTGGATRRAGSRRRISCSTRRRSARAAAVKTAATNHRGE